MKYLLIGGAVAAYLFRDNILAAIDPATAPPVASGIVAATTAATIATASGASPAAAAAAGASAAVSTPPTPITQPPADLASRVYQAAVTGLGGNTPLPTSGLFNLYQWNFYYSLVSGKAGPDLTDLLGSGDTQVNSTQYLQALAARGLV
jgi:hypothetical protein